MHDNNQTVKRKTQDGKKIKGNNHAQENPKMLKMHRLLLNCDNHAQKERCSRVMNIDGDLLKGFWS